MVFGGTQHPAVSSASDKGTLRLSSFALAYASAPCGFRSPSSLHVASLRYFGQSPRCHIPPILVRHLSGLISDLFSTASAPLLPDFIGFHFHLRGLVPPLRSAHAPSGIPSAHTRSLSIAFPSPSSLALTGARFPRTIPEVLALPFAFIPCFATLHIV